MKSTALKSNISLKEAEEHYQLSSENYTIESAECHLAYYREKHPLYYQILLNNVYPKNQKVLFEEWANYSQKYYYPFI